MGDAHQGKPDEKKEHKKMAVNLPPANVYLANIGGHLVALREALSDLMQDATYLNAMGGATFLEGAPYSLSTTDANLIASQIGAVTSSNTTVQALQGFIAATVTLTGGV